MKRVSLVVAGAIAACSGSPVENHFQVLVNGSGASADGRTQQLQMQAGEKLVVQLLVVGPVSGPVTFTGSKLPAFAAIEGSMLTLNPGRPDAGTFAFSITAASGQDVATVSIEIVVQRYNSAPTWGSGYPVSIKDRSATQRCPYICPTLYQTPLVHRTCTVDGPPTFSFQACDAEGDEMVGDLEVVPRGQPFTGRPTASVPATRLPYDHPDTCGTFFVTLSDLVLEQSYDFAIRISDQFGAVATSTSLSGAGPAGWYRDQGWTFDQGPCASKRCAGYATGEWCFGYSDCQSWSCDVKANKCL